MIYYRMKKKSRVDRFDDFRGVVLFDTPLPF